MQHIINKAYTRWVAAILISGHLAHAGNHRHGCRRCMVADLSCNCEACSLDAPGVVTPDTAPDISEPN